MVFGKEGVLDVEGIISALITGGLALIGVIITNRKTKDDITQEFKVAKAVTDTKIEELTREVREHNNFAKRMPVVENEIQHIIDDIDTLKDYHK
jgi:hypothetical protein